VQKCEVVNVQAFFGSFNKQPQPPAGHPSKGSNKNIAAHGRFFKPPTQKPTPRAATSEDTSLIGTSAVDHCGSSHGQKRQSELDMDFMISINHWPTWDI
jgi:hypothetical protein